MATEIERKFLLDAPPSGLDRHPSVAIDQGYLAITDDVEVRVRRRGARAWLTVKSDAGEQGRSRTEEELALDAQQFASLWPLTAGRRVRKLRHLVPLGDGGDGLTAEVDVYADALAGLLVAEVEFADEAAAEAFEPPAWLGREITDDGRYKNQALALHGRPR